MVGASAEMLPEDLFIPLCLLMRERSSWARAVALTRFLVVFTPDAAGVAATLVPGVLPSFVPSPEVSSAIEAAEEPWEDRDALFAGIATSTAGRWWSLDTGEDKPSDLSSVSGI